MSLIKCPECGKDVSETSKNCPHCGYKCQKLNWKKIILFISLILQSVVIFFSIIPTKMIYCKFLWELDEIGIGSKTNHYPTNIFGINNYGEFQVSFFFSLIFIILCILTVVFICFRLFGQKNSKNIFQKLFSSKEIWFAPFVALLFQYASCKSFAELEIHTYLSPDSIFAAAGDLGDFVSIWMYLQIAVTLTFLITNYGFIASFFKSIFKKNCTNIDGENSAHEDKTVNEIISTNESAEPETNELICANVKHKLKTKYIVELSVVILLLVVPILLNIAILNRPREYIFEEIHTQISYEQMREKARQHAVNECCEYSDVNSIKGFQIGSFDVNHETDDYWEVEMNGSYYPVDKYGDIVPQTYVFELIVRIDKSTGATTTEDSYLRKKY